MNRLSNVMWLLIFIHGSGCSSRAPATGTATEASYAGPAGSFRWPHGVVKYSLDSSFSSNAQAVAAFNDAVNEYKSFTGLTFKPQTDLTQTTVIYHLDSNYVADPSKCQPNFTIPRSDGPGWFIQIGCPNRPSVLHETGHAIGMSHEQKRPDSPLYVICHSSCVNEMQEGPALCGGGDFATDPGPVTVYAPFDDVSFMAYNSYDISNDPGVCPTLTENNGETCNGMNGSCIPEHIDFSVEDLNTLREVYEIALGSEADGDGFGTSIATGDFDHDGYVDLAVSAPTKTVNGTKSGAIYLYKGTYSEHSVDATGIVSSNFSSALVAWKRITPADFGLTPHDGDLFGQALESFDLDGDGISDLVIGAPGSESGAGAVYLMSGHAWQQPTNWGSPLPKLFDGLAPAAPVGGFQQAFFDQASLGIGPGQSGDNLGNKFIRGDFDGDGLNDLAVGEPGRNAGQVVLLNHQAGRVAYWKTLAPTSGATGSRFGNALVTADWDGDHKEDLAVGAPKDGAGAVWVYLTSQGMSGQKLLVGETAGEEYGAALATGDFYGTGVRQLAVGIPHRAGSGRIEILEPVTAKIFGFLSDAIIDQSAAGVTTSSNSDRFGQVLLGVALEGVANNSLIVGMPNKLDGVAQAGMVQILHVANDAWTGTVQHSPYIQPNNQETSSMYGNSIAVGDFNHDGHRDLAVGAPMYPVSGGTPSGAFWAWQGSSTGITFGSLFRSQSVENIRSN